MGFGRQAQRVAFLLPQIRHQRRKAEAALVAIEHLAAARVFQAVQARQRPLDTALLLRARRFFGNSPRSPKGEPLTSQKTLYGVPGDLLVFFLTSR